MKKSMFVYFLFLTICLFHLLVPDVVFGQAVQVFNNYEETFKHPDVHAHLPDVLNAFKIPENQLFLNSTIMNRFVDRPRYIWEYVPEADNSIVMLLALDDRFRALFRDDQFHTVVRSSSEIDRLVGWIRQTMPRPRDTICPPPTPEPVPEPRQATTLKIVYGNNQSGEVGKPLEPFVVGVLDQNGKPLPRTAVTFAVTADKGRLSKTMDTTDEYGQAQTTLTLGSQAEDHSVMARVAGISQTQTFTATATALPPPPEEPVPVVPVRSSTEEPPMYWIAGNTIYYRPTGGGKKIFNAPQDGTLTGGLAVDTVGRKVYWTEKKRDGTGRVRRADLEGNNVESFKDILAVPYDITVGTDKSGKRWVYWTISNKENKKIQRINNVDRSDFQGDFMEFPGSPTPPNHIAFDEKERRLYWTEMGRIRGVAANGEGKRDTIVDKLGELGGIAVADGVVYWTERAGDNLGKVGFRDITGQNDKKLLAVLEEIIPGGIAVDTVGGKVYWTTSHGIRSAPLMGDTVVIGEETPAGIALGGTAAVPAAPAAPSISPVVSVENTLLANYPNPFNPETWIPYQLSASADVSVSIYAVDGLLVRRLELGHQSAGVYQSRSRAAYWDGRNEFGERVASGLYFYTLTAGDFTATRKMLIRK